MTGASRPMDTTNAKTHHDFVNPTYPSSAPVTRSSCDFIFIIFLGFSPAFKFLHVLHRIFVFPGQLCCAQIQNFICKGWNGNPCRTFPLQVTTPRYENWQGDCWAGDKPPSMDNDSAFQEPDLVNHLFNLHI